MKYSVIIPVYKNKELFLKNLHHNQQFFKGHEVIIVDDCSQQNIAQEVKQKFPDFIIIENDKNIGFGPTMNRGVQKATGDILMFLNTDVVLKSSFNQVSEKFEKDADLFAITFAQLEKNGTITGKNRMFFKNGFVQHDKASNTQTGQNSWAEGGASAIRASMFRTLGGFRDIYAPFYWEDIDVSYRAYKQGWHIIFDQNYVVEHHHESTIGTFFSRATIKRIAYRNQLYFIWTNITDMTLLAQHIINIPLHSVRTMIQGDFTFILAFVEGLLSLPKAYATRRKNQKNTRMKDTTVFATLNYEQI